MPRSILCSSDHQTGKRPLFSRSIDVSSTGDVFFLQIIAYLLSPNGQQRKITKNIAELRSKLTTMNRQAEYTAYVRIERQIAAAERDLAAFQGSQVGSECGGGPVGGQSAKSHIDSSRIFPNPMNLSFR